MSKYKMFVIVTPGLASGFRLAGGAEVREARDGIEAGALIGQLLRVGREFGIICIDEDLNAQLDPKIIADVEEAGIPILVPFPGIGEGVDKMEMEEKYTANLIRSAIGYHIKLKRG